MSRTLAPADFAHYYPRLAKLSTLPHRTTAEDVHPDPANNGGHDDIS